MLNKLSAQTDITPFFISVGDARLFTIYFPPADGSALNKVVLHCPAFAEEMNKSRRMVACMARKLVQRGYGVLLVDPHGTGDSSGEFAEASWRDWRYDFLAICHELAEQKLALSLWGLRTGCLLALDVAAQSNLTFAEGLFWQPVLNGDTFLTQFLRLRLAANMMEGLGKEKTSTLKQQLVAGEAVEVAGYLLGSALAKPMLELHAKQFSTVPFQKIAVFELVANTDTALSPANQQWVSQLQNQSSDVFSQAVVGSPFWNTQEIAHVPALIDVSAQFFTRGNL